MLLPRQTPGLVDLLPDPWGMKRVSCPSGHSYRDDDGCRQGRNYHIRRRVGLCEGESGDPRRFLDPFMARGRVYRGCGSWG